MAIPVQDIIERVTDLLLDKDRGDEDARWNNDELIRWLNDSRMAIVTRRSQACTKYETIELIAGTLQSIPDDGIELIDVIRNMGMNGTTAGRAIRRTDRQSMDDTDMDWHTARKGSVVSQFTFDDRIPKQFYVSPPVNAGVQVQIAYNAIPPAITSLSDSLAFGLENMDAIVNYVAYRAKSKDSEYANAAEAAAFYGAFNDALGVQSQTQNAGSPNQPGNSV